MGRRMSGLIWNLELQGGSPCLCWLRPTLVGSGWTSTWMYWRIWDIWNTQTLLLRVSPSWTIPYLLMDVIQDTVEPPMMCPPRHTCGTRHKGEVGPGLTLWLQRELLSLVVPSWPACVVLSALYPCKFDYLFKSLRHRRIWVMACSPHLNVELSTS
jgi:hypothetical protein